MRGAPCGSDIPSILELQLRKSVELTARPTQESCTIRKVAVNQPDQNDEADTLKRLKNLLAETREMVTRAEALVAAIRNPRDAYSHG